MKVLEKFLPRNSFFRLETCNFTKTEPFCRYSRIILIKQEYLQNVDFSYLLVPTTISEFWLCTEVPYFGLKQLSMLFWWTQELWVIFTGVTTIISCAPRHIVFQKEQVFHQVFHLLNKKIQKIFQGIFVSIKWVTLKNFLRKNRLINIGPEHCFDVTLADFDQIVLTLL